MDVEWLEQFFEDKDGFPQPNWKAINEHVESDFQDLDQHELWCQIARKWMYILGSSLPIEYKTYESDNFIFISSEPKKYASLYQDFLEHTHKRILKTLHGIASDDGFGKYVVLIFDNVDTYYSYLFYFYPEDSASGLSSGVYLNTGYGHFAFPHQDLTFAEAITAHEMTHALLAHLPIPLWLNEGLAVGIEDMFLGSVPLKMDNKLLSKHKSFWGEKEMQEFWSGKSFKRTDEGQELSYNLAQWIVNSLSQDYDLFIQFTNKALSFDGGEAAAKEYYGGSLGNFMTKFLGEGAWEPKPGRWEEIE